MKAIRIFEKKSKIEAPVEEVFKWHAQPGAIQRLSPPWDPLKVIDQKDGIQTGAEVTMKMKVGPFSFKWLARHIDYEKDRFFKDEQIKGPFSIWRHTHYFLPDGPDACILKDRVEYSFPIHPISSMLLGSWIHKKLEKTFAFRHHTTMADISRHRAASLHQPMDILVSGASGMIGSSLIPFLTTGGHRVFRLVRKPTTREDEIFWNPDSGFIDLERFDGFDAVIHLAGENIGEGWWTKAKKKRIVNSRVNGTSTIVNAILKLKKTPKVFLSASAIGFYGNRGEQILTEEDQAGTDFVSDVCWKWESAADRLMNSPIRLALLRIGVVLSPSGGALAKLLRPFQMGVGGKISSGKQYMSWISMDDVIYSMHHALFNEKIKGPVNIVSPNPVTNADFSRSLGKVLTMPSMLTVPGRAVNLFFGEMGRETILSSTRVIPDRLVKSGYCFSHTNLESALKHLLGKEIS